jgi:hypothetical protein
MSVERVTYADSRVYVNNILLTGISSCEINATREFESLSSLLSLNTVDKILKSDQKPQVTLSWIVGEESSDPFFDFETNGILSVDSFTIKKRDILGTLEATGCFLTSYSVDASVGSLITANASYEALGYEFTDDGKLNIADQTSDYYRAFVPSSIQLSSNFSEGDIFSFPIQSFQISVPIQRKTIKKVGDLNAQYRYPVFPAEASISFSAIKNEITGLDFSKIVLEKGNFQIEMLGCDNPSKTYVLDNCSLNSVSESISTDEKALINFEYSSTIIGNSFLYY